MEETKKKLLLIKLSSLGDVIFNIPLANTLKAAGYEVTWLVSEKGIQVLEGNPCVDRVILAPLGKWKKRGFCLENFKEYLKILKEIRAQKFDIAIDSQMMLKSLYWMLFCGAKRRIISKKALEFAVLGGNEFVSDVSYHPKMPVVKNYLQYAKHLGLNTDDIKVTLPERTPDRIAKIDGLLGGLDKSKPLVIFAPATTWKHKHWNRDNWKTVADELSGSCNIVFTGGPGDNEQIEYINDGRFLNLAGKTDIKELTELFSRADVVIAPDSGSAHLAWASRNPAVVTIFTCTPKSVLAPYGDDKKYVALGGEGLPCQPCFKRKCRLKDNEGVCTLSPTPREVIETVKGLIFSK